MADEKSSSPTHPATPPTVLFVIFILVGSVFATLEVFFAQHLVVREIFQAFGLFFTGRASLGEIYTMTQTGFIRLFILLFQIIFLFFTPVLIILIAYTSVRLGQMMKKIHEPLDVADKYNQSVSSTEKSPDGKSENNSVAPDFPQNDENMPAVEDVNPKWIKVLGHINSDNPSDWRLAILEADIMLDEMLDKMGYPGQTLGEKLKMVERSDFDTLDLAWEAHKMRNNIAHEGSDLIMSKDEASRVITLFERVFKEFRYI